MQRKFQGKDSLCFFLSLHAHTLQDKKSIAFQKQVNAETNN